MCPFVRDMFGSQFILNEFLETFSGDSLFRLITRRVLPSHVVLTTIEVSLLYNSVSALHGCLSVTSHFVISVQGFSVDECTLLAI